MTTKRYILLWGDYEGGKVGWRCVRASGDTAEELLDIARREPPFAWEWCQVLDTEVGLVLIEYNSQQELCRHANTYIVPAHHVADSGFVVSGQLIVPGVYCSDCGAYLGEKD